MGARYHFWLFDLDTRPLAGDCSKVISCRIDQRELRLEPEGFVYHDLIGEQPCNSLLDPLNGRILLPLDAVRTVTLEHRLIVPRASSGATVAVRLDLTSEITLGGQSGSALYLAALDPLKEDFGPSVDETVVIYKTLSALLTGSEPNGIDPNPYQRAFESLGMGEAARRARLNPGASPRTLRSHPLTQRAQARALYQEFSLIFYPIGGFLSMLAFSLAMRGQPVVAARVGVLPLLMALVWVYLRFKAEEEEE